MKDILWVELDESERELEGPDDEDLTDAQIDARIERREAWEKKARKEVAWFFGELGGKVPEEGSELGHLRPAAEAIRGWLAAIPAFHRGALSLCFTPRVWPKELVDRYDEYTSLVVRLESARRPRNGSAAEVEEAAVSRLMETDPKRERSAGDLEERAKAHVDIAVRAYVKVRGEGRSVCPTQAARKPRKPVASGTSQNPDVPSAGPPANDVRVADAPANDVEVAVPPSSAERGRP